MTERTEELALSGLLPLTIGGQPVELRTLTIEESDRWLGQLAADLAALEVPISEHDGMAMLTGFLTSSAGAALRLIAAYDVEGVLGGIDAVRAKASKRELKAALEQMVTAEDPFGEDGARSVAAAFGAPSRLLRLGMSAALDEMAASLREPSMSGPSPGMASATHGSGESGPASSSSSAGPTRKRQPATRRGSG